MLRPHRVPQQPEEYYWLDVMGRCNSVGIGAVRVLPGHIIYLCCGMQIG